MTLENLESSDERISWLRQFAMRTCFMLFRFVAPKNGDRLGLFLGAAVGTADSAGLTREEFVQKADAVFLKGTTGSWS